MSNNELQRCPNCGCAPKLHKTSRGKFYYECDGDCWLQTDKYWKAEDAAKEWNSFEKREENWED